jgi:hypothetical protein
MLWPGRLDNFADELNARADALEHQSPSRVLEAARRTPPSHPSLRRGARIPAFALIELS